MPGTLLATLRAATAPHHARTESLVPVLAPALGLDAYGAVLARFHAAYVPLEAWLERVRAWPAGFDLAPRRKRPLLARDLAWLASRGVALPAVPPMPALDGTPSLPAAIGMLYVMEGATLGGQVIVRRLAPRLGLGPDAGAAFYTGYGARTGAMWRAFGAMADAWGGAHPDDWPEVVDAAQATFATIAAPFEPGSRSG